MKNRKWTLPIVLACIKAGFTIAVFLVLLAMEDMGLSSFVWDSKYPMGASAKVTFFIVTFLKSILICTFLLRAKEKFYRVIVLSVIGTLTILWLIGLGQIFFWDVFESFDAATELKVSVGIAITNNLIIVFACIWSLWKSRKDILKRT